MISSATNLQASPDFRTSSQKPKKSPYTILPNGFMPFEEFRAKFNLGETSTEKSHEVTKHLSQVAKADVEQGMQLLLQVDADVIKGLKDFMPRIAEHAQELAKKIATADGRVFLVGSGSSGRVGIDLAAKCNGAFPDFAGRVQGVLAGGDSTLIKPKENFEDSEKEGRKVLEEAKLTVQDTVILISASGSATFNEGCGHFAADMGATVFYFYNSENIPDRTRALFNRQNNAVKPLCIDIGPQAIAGSTRLQAATLAEACLGSLLASTLYHVTGDEFKANSYPQLLAENMEKAIALTSKHFADIATFCQVEERIFSDQNSNFRLEQDRTNLGYVTFVAESNCMREVLIDSTETSPTFSTNAMLKETETDKKRPEFCAYLVGEKDNDSAWQALLGRPVTEKDKNDTDAFRLAKDAPGIHSYVNRPTEQGNFVIGVAKQASSPDLTKTLAAASQKGADTGLIFLTRERLSEGEEAKLKKAHTALLCLENIPHDEFGLSETILLKQVLNIISNISMVLMGKVEGNLMIDVRAANKKLIDRCMRLVKAVWKIKTDSPLTYSDEELYCLLAHIFVKKEATKTYTPSPVKIILQMLALKTDPSDFERVCETLKQNNESIEW